MHSEHNDKKSIERIENMTKDELIQINVKVMDFFYKLTDEDKKTFKKDFQDIDKIFEKIYNKIEEREIDNYADELEKEYIQQEEELAKMYALNDIERANQ